MASSTSEARIGKAEEAFRAAFLRLREGRSENLPKGTKVTQNNVAREAGKDPSALKKDRFPALVREIQQWIELGTSTSTQSPRQTILGVRAKNKQLAERIDQLKQDRDLAQSLLMDAQKEILELTQEITSLRAQLNRNVIPIKPVVA